MDREFRSLLLSVKNPFRYVGGEVGSRAKAWEEAEVRLCLAFPDLYEIGMSHLGLSILYNIINDEAGMLADRVFAPWGDMEAELLKRQKQLFALESRRSIADFDIVGFSLAYELCYTNVLSILTLGGIPLKSSDRKQGDPVVIAGGPCAFNPMPMAPFFDAIVIGDGELAILDIAKAVKEWKCSDAPRMALFEKLAMIRGIYVPSIHDVPRPSSLVPRLVGKAHVGDLNAAKFPTHPLVPHKATQERAAVEVARGCARGCRFCQAGYIYRPVRQRSGESAMGLACEGLRFTGSEDFSFLSLSLGDWAPLEGSLLSVHDDMGALPVSASLPSLRVEALTQAVVDSLRPARHASPAVSRGEAGGRAGSFTLAPEAGTERMRRFINKGNTDDELYASVERVFAGGWHAIKLYFMIGLPGETQGDIDGIVTIANRCMEIARRHHRKPEVTVSTSTFVPKPHTPFQWERQISMQETLERQQMLKKLLRRPGLYYRWHDAGMSLLEGVFARGGEELASAVEAAYNDGARFDSWDECFNLGRWRRAFEASKIVCETYLNARDSDRPLPWEVLGVGPSKEFLLGELGRARDLMQTEDCTIGACSVCGICDFKDTKNWIAEGETGEKKEVGVSRLSRVTCVSREVGVSRHYRLRYKKTGRSAFLGSIETLDALRRALRASGLNLCYSEGYHPRALIGSGPALPVGVESEAEFVDVEIRDEIDVSDIIGRLKGRFPEGMEVVDAKRVDADASSIEESIAAVDYEVDLSGFRGEAEEAIKKFESSERMPFERVRRKGRQEVDLKGYIARLAVMANDVLGVRVRNLKPQLKIGEIVAALTGLDVQTVGALAIRKVAVEWKSE